MSYTILPLTNSVLLNVTYS